MRSIIFFIICFFSIQIFIFGQESSTNKVTKITLDAGHGGDKPGAIGQRSKEKDLTLSITLKLGKLINEYLKDVSVIYTRTTDKDIELYKRSQIANKNKSDLFISIHCNASQSREAHGTETFAMGVTKSAANLEVAKKENADILKEANYKETYEGFDPNSPESNIFFALYQQAYMNNSLSLADKVQKQFTSNTKLFNRGVKQAGFLVLYKSAMPSILIEVGFISNPKEEAYLMSQKGQYELAASIFRAICEYKIQIEGKRFPIPTISDLIPKQVIKEHELAVKAEQEKSNTHDSSYLVEQPENQKVIYRVQFLTLPDKISTSNKRFNGLDNVWCYKDNIWKYTSGIFTKYNEALSYQNEIRKKGYKDAFVIAFSEGKRITINKAKDLEK